MRVTFYLIISILAFSQCTFGQINLWYKSWPKAKSVYYPKDANVLDVTKPPYNAKGDGITDDTKAFQNAIWDALEGPKSSENKHHRIPTIYIPKGVYLITETLLSKKRDGRNMAFLVLQGEHRDSSIIKLSDNNPKFSNKTHPASLLYMVSLHNPSWYAHSPQGDSLGEGHVAFFNDVVNLTINTGKGNPGAIALNYHANNNGRVQDVIIRSEDGEGVCGLDMTRADVGPSLIKNVLINGFDFGVKVHSEYVNTFEYLWLKNQKKTSFWNEGEGVCAIRRMYSNNPITVVANTHQNGQVAIIDSYFENGSTEVPAINNIGSLFARGISTIGFSIPLFSNGKIITNKYIEEFTSDEVLMLFPGSKKSLALAVEETPEYFNKNPSDWVSVLDYGADFNDLKDDSKAIQKAIDAGKKVVYFPQPPNGGQYIIANTVHVRGKVRLIEGMYSRVVIVDGGNLESYDHPNAALRFEDGEGEDVTLNRILITPRLGQTTLFSFYGIELATKRNVVIKNSLVSRMANTTNCGKLFLENISSHHSMHDNYLFKYPQNIWARQFNPEDFTHTKVLNNGGIFWVLGLKTERPSVYVRTLNGGKTEVLGAFQFSNHHIPFDLPIFYTENSSVSLTFSANAQNELERWRQVIREKKGEEVKNVNISLAPKRYGNLPAPLVTLYKSEMVDDGKPWLQIEAVNTVINIREQKAIFKVSVLKGAPAKYMSVKVRIWGNGLNGEKEETLQLNNFNEVIIEKPIDISSQALFQSRQVFASIVGNENYRTSSPEVVCITVLPEKTILPSGINKEDFWVSADGNVLLEGDMKIRGVVSSGKAPLRMTINEADRYLKLDSNGINGKPALQFYQNFQFLPLQLGFSPDSIIRGKTIWTVIRTSDDVNTKQTLVEMGSANRGLNLYIEKGMLYFGAWQQIVPKRMNNVGPWLPAFIETTIKPETVYLVALEFDGKNRSLKAYLNGQLVGQKDGIGPLAQLNIDEDMSSVGATFFSSRYQNAADVRRFGCYFFNGRMAELLIQEKANKDYSRKSLQEYFMNKYKIK